MRQIKRGHYKEDEFQSTMEKAMKYIVRHRDKSIMIGIAVLAVAVLLITFFGRGEQSNPQADLLHTQALGFMTTGRIQDAEGVLRELTERHQNTRAGKVGLYYMGILTYHTGRFNESLEFFKDLLSSSRARLALFAVSCLFLAISSFTICLVCSYLLSRAVKFSSIFFRLSPDLRLKRIIRRIIDKMESRITIISNISFILRLYKIIGEIKNIYTIEL